MTTTRLLACSSFIALAMTALPAAAFAQDAEQTNAGADSEEAVGGEIIVTARKREESVKDIPSTITALTDEQLEAKGPIEGVGDLLQSVPGVRFNGLQSENLAEVSVRGSGTQRATSADSGVGLFVNGAYVGSSTLGGRNFKRIDYFDLARIEVLEGPQGALYGRNSEFGTVNIVLAEPAFRDGGRGSAVYTNELGQMRLEGIVNKAVNETVAVRFGAQVTGQSKGFYYNPNQEKYYDHTDGWIARGQIRYSDGPLEVKLLVDAMDMNLPTFVNQFVLPAGQLPVLPLGYTGPRYDVPRDGKDGVHQKVQRAMLTAVYDFDWAELTSTSMALRSVSEQDFSAAIDLATQAQFQQQGQRGVYPLGQTSTYARNKTLYQDLRLAGDASDALSWLVGFEGLLQDDFYTRDSATSPCALTLNAGICGGTPNQPICYKLTPNARDCPTPFPFVFGSRRETPSKYRSGAIYGSLKYDIGDLSLSGELRYSRDHKTATQTDYDLYTTNLAAAPSTVSFTQGNFSYSATAGYRLYAPVPVLLYAKTGSGYRAGGVNNGIFNTNAPNPLRDSYGNETTVSYEIGLKADLTRRIFFRLSGYTSETKDAIASILDGCTVTNACGQAGTYFNINGGTVRVRGVEASVDASFPVGAGRIALRFNAAHQDAKFVDVADGIAGLPVEGSPVAQSPDWTMSANANFRQEIADNATGFFNISYNGQRGGSQDTVTLATPYIPLEDIDNFDLRTGVDIDRVTLAFFVTNLTNQIVPILKLQAGTIPLVNRYSRPRTTGFSVSYRF
tara:strand:- start:1688 stop:4048 length:2361 start_codon:yes stop_codon:yes gene_type:complete